MPQGIPQAVLKVNNLVDVLRERSEINRGKRLFGFLKNGEELGQTYTFDELDTRARSIAAHLQEKGLEGERAVLMYPSSLEYMAAFFGCLYAGVIAVPVYPPQMGKQLSRIESIVKDSSPQIFMGTQDIFDGIESNMPEFAARIRGKSLLTDKIDNSHAGIWTRPNINEDSISFLQYTSGSTGSPKGVMISHGNLIANQRSISKLGQSHKDIVYVSWLPLFHDMGLIGTALQPLFYGFTSYLMAPFSFVQRPIRWVKAISDLKATFSVSPNFGYDLCASRVTDEEVAQLDLSSWDTACNGAEPVRMDTLKKFEEKFAPAGFRSNIFFPLYGMAESTLIITGWEKGQTPQHEYFNSEKLEQNKVEAVSADHPNAHQIANCGHTDDEHEVRIVNPETLQACKEDEIGEIWFKGPSVAKGYWETPTQSKETFEAYLPNNEGPFLRTGDLGFLRGDKLYITGRFKDLIIIRGKNHYPQDIELTVENSHKVLRPNGGAAFSVEAAGDERLVVIYEVDRGLFRKVDNEEVFKAIRESISKEHELQVYAIKLVKRRSILKTSSGKIMRRACKKAYLAGELYEEASWQLPLEEANQSLTVESSDDPIKSSQEILEWITNWMSQKLSIPVSDIDTADSMNAYGTDSMMTAEFEEEVSKFIGVEWPVMDYLITEPSIMEVAERGEEWAKDQVSA